MWDSAVILISKKEGYDDAGDIIENVEQEKKNQIFCNEISVGQNEFYQAMANGLKPEVKLEINKLEYANEKKAEYSGIVYDVIRTFTSNKNDEVLELTLGGGINAIT